MSSDKSAYVVCPACGKLTEYNLTEYYNLTPKQKYITCGYCSAKFMSTDNNINLRHAFTRLKSRNEKLYLALNEMLCDYLHWDEHKKALVLDAKEALKRG